MDDLRRDVLTFPLISIMDAFWLQSQINLNMRTHEVIMVELVSNSKTTNDINSSLLGSNIINILQQIKLDTNITCMPQISHSYNKRKYNKRKYIIKHK